MSNIRQVLGRLFEQALLYVEYIFYRVPSERDIDDAHNVFVLIFILLIYFVNMLLINSSN